MGSGWFIILLYSDIPDYEFWHLGSEVFVGLAKTVLQVYEFRLPAGQWAEGFETVLLLKLKEVVVREANGIFIGIAIGCETLLYASYCTNTGFNKGVFIEVEVWRVVEIDGILVGQKVPNERVLSELGIYFRH